MLLCVFFEWLTYLRTIKKGHRCDPIFVNLKSNTMKNTMQR